MAELQAKGGAYRKIDLIHKNISQNGHSVKMSGLFFSN